MCFLLVVQADAVRRPPTLAIAAQRSSIAADPQLRSVGDGDAHRTRGAGDDLLGGVEGSGVCLCWWGVCLLVLLAPLFLPPARARPGGGFFWASFLVCGSPEPF